MHSICMKGHDAIEQLWHPSAPTLLVKIGGFQNHRRRHPERTEGISILGELSRLKVSANAELT